MTAELAQLESALALAKEHTAYAYSCLREAICQHIASTNPNCPIIP